MISRAGYQSFDVLRGRLWNNEQVSCGLPPLVVGHLCVIEPLGACSAHRLTPFGTVVPHPISAQAFGARGMRPPRSGRLLGLWV
jgi:hypothetical protein